MQANFDLKLWGPWSRAIQSKIRLGRDTYSVRLTIRENISDDLTVTDKSISSTAAIPRAYIPSNTLVFPIVIVHGGIKQAGILEIKNDGWINILPLGESGFSKEGPCGILATSVSYHI